VKEKEKEEKKKKKKIGSTNSSVKGKTFAGRQFEREVRKHHKEIGVRRTEENIGTRWGCVWLYIFIYM
jgi:hypothetical protein